MARGRWKAAGGVLLAAATAGVAYGIVDDVLLFQKCSRAALQEASKHEEFTSLVGTPQAVGPWYTATLGVSHGGRSVSATFDVNGPLGSASLHARALRMKGGRSTLLYNVVGEGEWHLFALNATVWQQPLPAAPLSPLPASLPSLSAGPSLNGAGVGASPNTQAGAPLLPPPEAAQPAHTQALAPPHPASLASQVGPAVRLDLLSPRGMPPLPSAAVSKGDICLPCEAQAQAKGAAQHARGRGQEEAA